MTSAPGLRRAISCAVGRRTFEHHVGAERFIRRDKPRAGRLIVGVGESGVGACAMLDRDLRSESGEFLDRFRAGCDARLPRIGLRGHSYQHESFPKTVDVRRDERSFRFGVPSRSRSGGQP